MFNTGGGTMRFTIDNGPENIKSKLEVQDSAVLTGEWVHVVAVRDAVHDSIKIYANAELQGWTVDKSGDISSHEPLWIGESTDEAATAMSGDMKDLRIYNYAMSPDKINELFVSYDISIGIDDESGAKPLTYKLMQNYPNPFNPKTNIQFQIPKDGHVTISVYNTLGQRVETLVDENMRSGMHNVTFDAAKFTSGIYFYKIESGKFSEPKKMLLIK
jgi:hypothetical protein